MKNTQEGKGGEENKAGKDHLCILCGKLSLETICEPCKTLVRAEAIERKRRAEKGRE